MHETTQQYIARILGHLGDADPWDVLSSTAGRLRDLTAGGREAGLSRKPGPGRWSVGEILAHLADCEIVAGWRLRSILAHDAVTIQPFDQDVWADAFKYDSQPPLESLELFEATRLGNLRLLRRVDPPRLGHYGMHEERGRESVTHLVRLYAGHDLNHLRQIERLVGRSGEAS
jgi:hypothetical protein